MKNFVHLFYALQSSSSDSTRITTLQFYFQQAGQEDIIWCLALLMGKRPSRVISTKMLRSYAEEKSGIPDWLFEQSYRQVGDIVETVAKIVPKATKTEASRTLASWISVITELKTYDDNQRKQAVYKHWDLLDLDERLIYNKLLTGGFRYNIKQKTIAEALAYHLGQEVYAVTYKLKKPWAPHEVSFDQLLLVDDPKCGLSKPYPFYLAHTVDIPADDLGEPSDWLAEYKWDGMRVQLVKRSGQAIVWSRVGELISDLLPEFIDLESCQQDFVIDGELVVFKEKIMSSEALHKRLAKKKPTKRVLDDSPVILIAYDIIELDGKDLRPLSQLERRKILEKLIKEINSPILSLSDLILFNNWQELAMIKEDARAKSATGLLLKSKEGFYKEDRDTSEWYKWRIAPFSIKAVMLYAHRSTQGGRRFSAFTFAVIDENIPEGEKRLVVIAKAAGELPDDEAKEISKFIKENTVERFGPVLSVTPLLVFEISFVDVINSTRNKAGLLVKSPKISKWLKEKSASEINTLQELQAYILN